MATKSESRETGGEIGKQLGALVDTYKNITILQLFLAGVPRPAIRATVGVDQNRVTKILKGVKAKGADGEETRPVRRGRRKGRRKVKRKGNRRRG